MKRSRRRQRYLVIVVLSPLVKMLRHIRIIPAGLRWVLHQIGAKGIEESDIGGESAVALGQ